MLVITPGVSRPVGRETVVVVRSCLVCVVVVDLVESGLATGLVVTEVAVGRELAGCGVVVVRVTVMGCVGWYTVTVCAGAAAAGVLGMTGFEGVAALVAKPAADKGCELLCAVEPGLVFEPVTAPEPVFRAVCGNGPALDWGRAAAVMRGTLGFVEFEMERTTTSRRIAAAAHPARTSQLRSRTCWPNFAAETRAR